MNARRVQSSINGLQRDITNYEAFLSKVIKGKVDKPKSAAYKPAHNVNPSTVRGRSVTPFVSDPSVKIHYPPKTRSRPQANTKSSNTVSSVLCEEVFENSNATVEVRVKTKRPNVGISRKRSRSNTLTSLPEVDRYVAKDEIQKQSNAQFQHSDPTKHNMRVQNGRESHSHLNEGSLPWAHILQHKNNLCMIHRVKPKDKDEVSPKKLHGYRKSTRRSCKRQHKRLVPEDSISSSISDDSSDDQKSSAYISRSVQCSLPEIIVSDDKQKDMPPSKLSAECKCSSNVGGGFSTVNPVRTLKFLIKELRGKLQKSEDGDNLQRIIADMEVALMHIPSEIKPQTFADTSDIPTRDETATLRSSQIRFVPLKPAETYLSTPAVVPKFKVTGQGPSREYEHVLPALHEQQMSHTNLHSSKLAEPAKEITPEVNIAQRELELTRANLELKCRQLELACDQLRKERDNLIAKMQSMEGHIEEVHNKEKDYLTTISCLRSNLENMKKKVEEQAKVVAELAASNAQLIEENKTLLPFNDAEAIGIKLLKESSEEERKLQAQLQTVKLECNKFEILLASKDKELEKLKQELRDIEAFASEQQMNLKSFSTIHKTAHQTDSRKQSLFNNKPKLDFLAREVSLCLRKPQTDEGEGTNKQPVFSSPTSSVVSFIDICPSWKNISRIAASDTDVNKLSSKEVSELSQTGNNNIKDSRHNSDLEGNRSSSLINPGSPEFKSFCATSLSEDVSAEARHESSITELKTCKELKDELRNKFDEIKKQARMGTGVSLPSPPHQYSEISEPSGMHQWSEISDAESIQNSLCFSSSSAEVNNRKFDLGNNDLSFENKFEADC